MNGVRISGGRLRGRRLAVPRGVRPTEGRVREALLAIWQERIPGARFLDLFAGSGAVGLEAWSRGAARVTFVEGSPRAASLLRRRCRELAPEGTDVIRGRLPGVLRRLEPRPHDLLFADPPYRYDAHAALIEAAAPWFAGDGELAVEHAARVELPERCGGCERVDCRAWGEIAISFYRPW